ncbi:multidrug efflux SMR transporter [Rhizobium rhizogenes]|uniref:QacE family quaternary ammonium compound efflux SMR transporter n=1 Tax=Rhizobium rhizogenes TaxID=359 RepID=A0AA92C789_RHIRH|nr:SMR family transporter [Rhizobium rhizogenes]PVE57273.1 QacE family quaternary ammonium compound efflux SMR transporter [Rhizobium rhizogenes]PVE68212.1 QacE family quaternary ammonium compound efflux SMR transporter [Agrobacterium tumefaciens]PVE77960.1 QacE family quaternary ammonium compound efflux SMR transporter [Sphingomonas sp. TPD3009]
MPAYAILALAVISEVVATMSLKASKGFTVLVPSIAVVIGYGAAFFFLSMILDRIPVGIAYAIWAGGGILLTATLGCFVFGQRVDFWGFVGMAFILAGVLILNLLSKSSVH